MATQEKQIEKFVPRFTVRQTLDNGKHVYTKFEHAENAKHFASLFPRAIVLEFERSSFAAQLAEFV